MSVVVIAKSNKALTKPTISKKDKFIKTEKSNKSDDT